MQSLFHYFREETVLRCEVRQLPQTSVEPVLSQLLQHSLGVFKTVFGKLIVTLPINTEPACVEMNDIRRNLMGTKLAGNFQAFFLREIGDAAHPRAETPEWRHRTLARDVGVFVKNFLGRAKEHEEVYLLVGHKKPLGTDVRSSEVGCDRG